MSTPQETPPPDSFSQAFLADPFPTLHRLRAERPVYWHPIVQAWFLTRHADVQTMLRDRRFSAERVGYFSHPPPPHMLEKQAVYHRFLSLWLVFLDPPRHTALRALVAKAFTPRIVESLQPFTEQLVDGILDAAIRAGKMDVIKDLSGPLPAAVIGRMLGIPSADVDQFRGWTNDVFSAMGAIFPTEEVVEAAYRGTLGLLGYFRDIIAERRRAPGDNLLSQLVLAEVQGEVLTEEELVATCALLLSGGHETLTHGIGNAVLALLRNPAELATLRAHPELLPGAVEELARYDAAVYMLGRRVTESVDCDGHRFEPGQFVIGMVGAAGRDPAVYADPDRLDVTRRDVQSLGFGYGLHFCLGAPLARMETRVVLGRILERLPVLHLASESLEWIPSALIHGVVSLPVTF